MGTPYGTTNIIALFKTKIQMQMFLELLLLEKKPPT